jgi:hypothetical protein
MRHFVQYHNADTRGRYRAGKGFGIETNKAVDGLLGDRVWLVTGEGAPRRYFLCETFIVDGIDRNSGVQGNVAFGHGGAGFEHPASIDQFSWFEDLREATGNFAFGLQRVKSQKIIRGLRRVLATGDHNGRMAAPRRAGARFGVAAANRLVERAAVRAVTEAYKSKGWAVKSRERLCLGYDLCCSAGKKEEHVEVKGIRGALCSFVITANEIEAAKCDPYFKLCAVTNAMLRARQKIWEFSGTEFSAGFNLLPIAYVAKPKGDKT